MFRPAFSAQEGYGGWEAPLWRNATQCGNFYSISDESHRAQPIGPRGRDGAGDGEPKADSGVLSVTAGRIPRVAPSRSRRRTLPFVRRGIAAPAGSRAAAGIHSAAFSAGRPTRPRLPSIRSYRSFSQTPSRRAVRPNPPSPSCCARKIRYVPFFKLPKFIVLDRVQSMGKGAELLVAIRDLWLGALVRRG